MKKINIDFDNIETMDDFYAIVKKKLSLPEYFGNNLDALWDSITGEIELPVFIELKNLTLDKLDKFELLINLFEDACVELQDNFQFEYYIKDEELDWEGIDE